jgi:hypothetical protein
VPITALDHVLVVKKRKQAAQVADPSFSAYFDSGRLG